MGGSLATNALYYPQMNGTILDDTVTSIGVIEWFLTTAYVNLGKHDITCGVDQHFGFVKGRD